VKPVEQDKQSEDNGPEQVWHVVLQAEHVAGGIK
jgi:hypothetical protein